jgi:hypothetical protein
MNWQAVINHMREDARELERVIMTLKSSDISSNTTVAVTALVLHKIADALQMGLNKRNEQ